MIKIQYLIAFGVFIILLQYCNVREIVFKGTSIPRIRETNNVESKISNAEAGFEKIIRVSIQSRDARLA